MAAGAFTSYYTGVLGISNNSVNFLTDTIKCALVTAAYTPNRDTHDNWSDVVANEIADAGYTAGGLALGTKAITEDVANANRAKFDAADVSFGTSVTLTAKYAVIYKDTTITTTSTLLGYIDLNTAGGSVSSTNSDFAVNFDATGMFTITS